MRELKFRAWGKNIKEYLSQDGVEPYGYPLGAISDGCIYDIDGYIIEQYTGLKDKNGKEIYEGDIVQCGAYVGQIKWLDGLGCWGASDTSLYSFLKIKGITLPASKIIGNIHENPELLREEEE